MYRSAIEERVEVAETAVRLAVAGIDPDGIPASEATRIYEGLERIVRTSTAARTVLSRRVDDSMEWKRQGYRSAAPARHPGVDRRVTRHRHRAQRQPAPVPPPATPSRLTSSATPPPEPLCPAEPPDDRAPRRGPGACRSGPTGPESSL